MHDAMPAGIWPHNPLLLRQGNGHTRHILSIQSLARPRPSLGYHYPSCPHNANPQGSFPVSLHQQSRNASSHWPHPYWSKDINEVPCPLCPYWQHRETLTIKDGLVPLRWSTHHPSCWKGESPASTASIPSRNYKVTVTCTWKFLLAWYQ